MRRSGDFFILYPSERWVSATQIRTWYEDAKADGMLENPNLNDTTDMAHELSNIGWITLGKGRNY